MNTRSPSDLWPLVHQLLAPLLPHIEETVLPSLRLRQDLNMNMLSIMELALSLERELTLTFPEAEIFNWFTVQDVYQSVAQQMATEAINNEQP